MDNAGKLVSTFLLIIAVILGSVAILFYVEKEREKSERMSLGKRLDEIIIAKQNLEVRLKELEVTNADLRTNIRVQEEKIDGLSKQLEEARSQTASANARLQEKESEIKNLAARIEDEKAEKSNLTRRFEKLNEDYLYIKFQLEGMIKAKEEAERQIEAAKEAAAKSDEDVSLGTIVVKQ